MKIHFSSAMWLTVIAALLVAIQPRLNFISVSGMENHNVYLSPCGVNYTIIKKRTVRHWECL